MTVTKGQINDTFGSVEPTYGGGGIIPVDTYNLQIVTAEVLQAKSSGNHYVHYSASVVDGDFATRRVFDNLHLGLTKADGSDSKAQGMTMAMLRLMLGDVPDSINAISRYDQLGLAEAIAAEITGAFFTAKVEIEGEEDDEFGQKNRVSTPRRRDL